MIETQCFSMISVLYVTDCADHWCQCCCAYRALLFETDIECTDAIGSRFCECFITSCVLFHLFSVSRLLRVSTSHPRGDHGWRSTARCKLRCSLRWCKREVWEKSVARDWPSSRFLFFCAGSRKLISIQYLRIIVITQIIIIDLLKKPR